MVKEWQKGELWSLEVNSIIDFCLSMRHEHRDKLIRVDDGVQYAKRLFLAISGRIGIQFDDKVGDEIKCRHADHPLVPGHSHGHSRDSIIWDGDRNKI